MVYPNYYASLLNLQNATISQNSAGLDDPGGGILARGFISINSSTITENTANTGGGIYQLEEVAQIRNSIVSGNSIGVLPDNLRVGSTGNFSGDFNLLGSGEVTNGADDIITDSAGLGPLQNNGGPTETHALLMGSLAIDMGDPSLNALANDFDQRGDPYLRNIRCRIDIGAFEVQSTGSGDFDNDGKADGLDFLAWQKGAGITSGATQSDGDSDGDGDVDSVDLFNWEAEYCSTNTATSLSENLTFHDDITVRIELYEQQEPALFVADVTGHVWRCWRR